MGGVGGMCCAGDGRGSASSADGGGRCASSADGASSGRCPGGSGRNGQSARPAHAAARAQRRSAGSMFRASLIGSERASRFRRAAQKARRERAALGAHSAWSAVASRPAQALPRRRAPTPGRISASCARNCGGRAPPRSCCPGRPAAPRGRCS